MFIGITKNFFEFGFVSDYGVQFSIIVICNQNCYTIFKTSYIPFQDLIPLIYLVLSTRSTSCTTTNLIHSITFLNSLQFFGKFKLQRSYSTITNRNQQLYILRCGASLYLSERKLCLSLLQWHAFLIKILT